MYRDTLQQDAGPDMITRGPSDRRDNRNVVTSQAIQLAGFADVRPTNQHHRNAIAKHRALLGFQG